MNWIAKTNGKEIWAINPKQTTKRKCPTLLKNVESVVCEGNQINIVTEDGRVRVWDLHTDTVRVIM